MVAFLWIGSHQEAKDVFLTILPISAAVVTYWFANRANSKSTPNAIDDEPQGASVNEDEPPFPT